MRTSKRLGAKVPLAILVAVLGCSGPNEPGRKGFTYPLVTGNSWEYRRTWILTDLRSGAQDTMGVYNVSVRVTGRDSLHVSPAAFRIHAELSEGFGDYGAEAVYQNRSDGLYGLALCDTGHATFHARPKWHPSLPPHFNDAWPLPGIVQIPEFADYPAAAHDGDWTWYDPPLLVLRYPLQGRWRYRSAEPPDAGFSIDKEVIGRDTITVPAGTFDCHEIVWRYSISVGGINATEYVSAVGLVRRVFRLRLSLPDSTESADIVELLHYSQAGAVE